MPSLEEIRVYQARIEGEKRLARKDRLRLAASLGQAMSEVTADPRWKVYADHLEALRQRKEVLLKVARDRLNGQEFLEQKEYGQLKLDIAENFGYVSAMRDVLRVITELVEQGQAAVAELKEGESNASKNGTVGNAG